jgi:O-antigen/teichoic acid export membrane protein
MRNFTLISALRMMSGIAQFLIILTLASQLTLDQLGAYSLFVIFLGYCTQIAGLSLYTLTLREIASSPPDTWPAIQYRQTVFLLSTVAATSGVAYLGMGAGLLKVAGGAYLIALLALTVLNTQNENFLVGVGSSVSAALVLLVRTSWIYVLLVFSAFSSTRVSLSLVFLLWTLAEAAAFLLIALNLHRHHLLPMRRYEISSSWVRQAVETGGRFSLMSLFLLVMLSAPRVTLGQVGDQGEVGVMHFYFVVTQFGPNLVEASLYSILLPKLLKHYEKNSGDCLTMPARWRFYIVALAGVVNILAVHFLLPMVIAIAGNPGLLNHQPLAVSCCIFSMIYAAARVLHYELFAAGFDRWLFTAYGASCIVGILGCWPLVDAYGLYGAAMSQLLSGIVLLLMMLGPFIGRQKCS